MFYKKIYFNLQELLYKGVQKERLFLKFVTSLILNIDYSFLIIT